MKTSTIKSAVIGLLFCFGAPSLPWANTIANLVPHGRKVCTILTSTTFNGFETAINPALPATPDDNPYYVNCDISQSTYDGIQNLLTSENLGFDVPQDACGPKPGDIFN